MKKIVIVIVFFWSMTLLSCNRIEKLSMTTLSSITETEKIDVESLSDLLSSNSTFIVYVSSETCSSCQEFQIILDQFIEQYHVLIYQIESSVTFPTDNEFLEYQFTPTLFFIQNGNVLEKGDGTTDEEAFVDLNAFSNYFLVWVDLNE